MRSPRLGVLKTCPPRFLVFRQKKGPVRHRRRRRCVRVRGEEESRRRRKWILNRKRRGETKGGGRFHSFLPRRRWQAEEEWRRVENCSFSDGLARSNGPYFPMRRRSILWVMFSNLSTTNKSTQLVESKYEFSHPWTEVCVGEMEWEKKTHSMFTTAGRHRPRPDFHPSF